MTQDEMDYRQERYLDLLERDHKRLREAVKEFLGQHFHGGSKADRSDYVVSVPTRDIYSLKRALEE